jgi:hypothetical protein
MRRMIVGKIRIAATQMVAEQLFAADQREWLNVIDWLLEEKSKTK